MRSVLLVVLFCLSAVACAPKRFPGTQIVDTTNNREVLAFVGDYQKAMESLNAESIIALASPSYVEDRGTLDEKDDYGIDGLREILSKRFTSIQNLRYTIRIKNLDVTPTKAMVDFHYSIVFQFKVGDTARWHQAQDDSRLELEKIDGKWKAFRGL